MSGQQTSDSTTTPWSVQTPYIKTAFSSAQNAMQAAEGANVNYAPKGFTASFSPGAFSTYANMLQAGNNQQIPSWLSGAGLNALQSGSAGSRGAMADLGAFDPSAANNPTSILSAAGKYADNPYISGEVQAAMRDATQQANEVTLPGIEQNAAATNNVNSNRTGIAEGLVARNLGQQAGDISAGLRGSAFNTGLATAEEQALGNNSQRLNAITGAGGLGLGLYGAGGNALNSAVANTAGLYGLASAGAAQQQQANQAPLTNQQQQWQWGQQAPFSPVNSFYNIVGANNWGGNTHTTVSPSMWSVIGGLMGGLGSLGSGFRSA